MCEEQTYMNLTFQPTHQSTTSYSTQRCKQGYAEASLFCNKHELMTNNGLLLTSKFDKNTFTKVDCDLDLSHINITTNATQAQIESTANALQLLTTKPSLTTNEANKVVAIIDSITMATTMNHTVTEALLTSIITTVSRITHLLTTPSILHDVNILTSSVQLNNQQIYSIHTPTMIVQIQDTHAGHLIFSPTPTTNTSDANISPITVNLPTPANGRASFIFHTTSQLFPSKDKPNHVISVSLGLGRVPNLTPPLVYSLNNERTQYGRTNIPGTLEANYYRQRCVFWDFATSDWSSEGCGLDVTKHPPTCECSHLTNFALLVSVEKVPADFALEIAGKVGCSVCIAAYVAIIIILLLNKKIRNKTSTKIQLHVCFNLMVAYLLFMIGVPSVGNKTTCTTVAVLLHYTFLTSWFWMGIYSNRLYVCLVKVFPRPTTNYTWKSSIFAYGVPLIIVSINAGVTLGVLDKQRANHDIIQASNPQYLPPSYYRADNVCWLHSWSLYFGFLLFVGIILLNNLVVFVLVLNQLCWRESEIRSSANKQRKSHKVMLACSAMIYWHYAHGWLDSSWCFQPMSFTIKLHRGCSQYASLYRAL
ncbi:adhesion G-protein coupled receptor G4-like [Ciona intestinalis]